MQKYDIHVCLISNEAAANTLPTLLPEFKPEEAIFFISQEMKEKADSLEKTFKENGIQVHRYMISDAWDFDTTSIEIIEALADFAKEKSLSELNIGLNVTGGTKVMAIAAQTIFSEENKGKDIFYVNTKKEKISFLTRKENDFKMSAKLNLNTYFSSYGFDVLTLNRKFETKLLSIFETFFIEHYHKNWNLISVLNGYVQAAIKRAKSKREYIYTIQDDDKAISALNDFLQELSDFGFIKYDGLEIDFLNEKNAKFAGGTWFEHYVHRAIYQSEFKNEIDDLANSIEVANRHYDSKINDAKKGRNNEFDVAFIAKNKLHLIECKTYIADDENPDIYKVDSLRKKSGTETKSCFISYRQLPPAVLNRAKDSGIEVIQGSEVQQVSAKIKLWIEK